MVKHIKATYGICEVNRDIHKIRKTFHHNPLSPYKVDEIFFKTMKKIHWASD
jgi:hypothetical protein